VKILLLNQCFYPDVMATAQQLSDLAVGLVKEGHSVTVITSDRGYDDPSRRFARRETWNGVKIVRISSLTLGKQKRWHRAANFASFLANCALRLSLSSRFDVVVALTSPPLISFLGAVFARVKGGKFFFWIMDLNPDEAIAAGWLKPDSLSARLLQRLLRYSLIHAEKVVALDQFMRRRIVEKGVPDQQVIVLPPWSHDDSIKFDLQGRVAFRKQHDLDDSFVVMYAGNHSPCHSLNTLIEAARTLVSRKDIMFCFIGGGSEQVKVMEFAALNGLSNIRCFPYQAFDVLSALLSAADLHVVVMGNEFVGIIHPSKVYNILAVGSPFLYIGPEETHITEIAAKTNGEYRSYAAAHGDVERVVNHILQSTKHKTDEAQRCVPRIAGTFSKQTLLPRMIKLLESQVVAETEVSSKSRTTSCVSAAR
jgi:colanic acid biosynthesis glycosyl transferase WcaI